MIPSLVVTEIRSALVEYLASTFALADDEVREALSAFLEDEAEGIFRGPYVQVRTPFRSVADGWRSPLEWLPEGFVPYEHQGRAFERLSTAEGREPRPALVTTGTGSGKTECFLYPILDHCARMKADRQDGIKALVLYPMNALASDQAGRLAELIHGEARLAGITAGLYVGEQGRHSSMGADHLIDRREVLRAEPPDILLTNYKMLDFLLLRADDRDLWAVNRPDTLRYVVLDEFHTYDGAQGTDVAMLLRRLGATLQMAGDRGPLGPAVPVATSATMGSGGDAVRELREFAGKVFGATFDEGAVIGETRQTPDEACGDTNYFLPIPDVGDVADLTELDAVVAAFCTGEDGTAPESAGALTEALLTHPLTRAVLTAVGDRPRAWSEGVERVVAFAPNWGRALATGDRAKVERALTRFLWLLSAARRDPGGRDRPLFSIDVQLWIREVSRLQRSVTAAPAFRWRDSATTATEVDEGGWAPRPELPAVYCRRCGMSGWMALASESGDTLSINPATIGQAALNRSPLIRTMMRAHTDDAQRRWYSPSQRRLADDDDQRGDMVPVLVSPSEDDARINRCPGCGERDGVRFLGLAVASLASVSINTLFGSAHVEGNERKLLAFTDSVQDASHRAGFFSGRTHRINLRSLMAGIIADCGEVSLADLGDLLLEGAATARDRFGLVPPDLLRHPIVRTAWTDQPAAGAAELLGSRLGFEVDLELGLRSRVGRTLELSWVAAAEVQLDDAEHYADLLAEEVERLTGRRPDPYATLAYLTGLLERLRLRGGLAHPLLAPFLANGGRDWFLWGGRPSGLPPFTHDQSQPSFYTTATQTTLDSLTAPPRSTPTWLIDWATRCLGLEPGPARQVNILALDLLARDSDTITTVDAGASTIYALDRRRVRVVDVPDDDGAPLGSHLRCDICGHVHVAPPASVPTWAGTPCLRYRCVGRLQPATPRGTGYYRRLYREGTTRRVVTAEHTGLLGRRAREDVEQAFKEGTAPDAPNVLTATPTLEMGIDIGDLSAVMLTSVPRRPASYLQRVGRAGRRSGNSLVTTFVTTDKHGLYYLADPESMLAGDVRPPSCYLDAIETLQRQYLAYLFDRAADQTIDAPVLPRQVSPLMTRGLERGGFLAAVVDAATDPTHLERFLRLFGSHLAPHTVERLTHFATAGIVPAIKAAAAEWERRRNDLHNRRRRLNDAIERLEADAETASAHHRPSIDEELANLRGQRSAVSRLLHAHRNEYSLSALERLGLLPNYTLVDDGVTLSATMWSRNDKGEFETDLVQLQRSGRYAIRELAPGNSFYAGGHRHVIDALEIGSADEPLYEQWRLCPECGYGEIDTEGEPATVCPHCAGQAIADTGARHTVLRLRAVSSSGSEEAARVYDESDDRRRQRYDTILTVDVEPEHVSGAWRLGDRAFGVELAARTHLRTFNLGLAERSGETVPIAGHDHHVSRFTVCNHCGAVAEARNDQGGEHPERLHHGWCRVRSGSLSADWRSILLLHELTTEAIRILVPVSMFEVDERLASFKGALLLGLRHQLGGDPDHLEIARCDAPNRAGQGRKQFLVLFDNVPGGTGYLASMADPDQLRAVLGAARNLIALCPCTAEGRTACHRCLMGVVNRDEYDLVRRDLALEIIDDLLEGWEPDPVTTVGDIDIGQVQESELERRFKVALRDWADRHPSDEVSLQTVPGRAPYNAYELRLVHDGETSRYRIDEQEGLSTSPSSIPDFLIRRVDARGPTVAVYLDGYQFHAALDGHNNIAADAAKRRAARADGKLVWNLVWADVEAFHRAVLSDPPRHPPPSSLLRGPARAVAQGVQHQTGGGFDVDALNQNPMGLLLDYLARPDNAQWQRLALSAVAGMAAPAQPKPIATVDDARQVLAGALAGQPFEPPPPPSSPAPGPPLAMVSRAVTTDDLPLVLVLDTRDGSGAGERWTVIAALEDTLTGEIAVHQSRWQNWLHWANVLQLIGGTGRDAVIAATSEGPDYPLDDLWLTGASPPPPDGTADPAASRAAPPEPAQALPDADLGTFYRATAPPAGLVAVSETMEEELDLVEDDQVRELARQALTQGAPELVSGYEHEGTPLEVAWPDLRVAVLLPDQVGFTTSGWDARPVGAWTAPDLISALKERT